MEHKWDLLSGVNMSDRIILIRIQGLGSLLSNDQMVFTSRGTLPYLPAFATLPGVVSNLGDQFSSEIGFFESMGSDPTTSFSVISTAETREALLGRRKVPVLDGDNAPVVTTSYIPPLITSVQFGVSDTSSMFVGQRVRIGSIAWEVTNVVDAYTIRATRIWGSPRTPIPMILAGQEAVGMVVYDLLLSTGSVEGLPVVVSTAEVTATSRSEEDVIFRGQVTKVGVETSRGAANQITVQCGSLMGYLRNTAFRPPIGSDTILSATLDSFDPLILGAAAGIGSLETKINTGVYGVPTWASEGQPVDPDDAYKTSMRAWQVRDGGRGCVIPYSTNYFSLGIQVEGQTAKMPFATGGLGWLMVFDSSYYTPNGGSPLTDSMVNFAIPYNDRSRNQTYNVTAPSESAFVCKTDTPDYIMLLDLLFGTVDDYLGTYGWRAATEAAWLPYEAGVEVPSDLVDLASLEALLQGRNDVFPNQNDGTPEDPLFRVLPYDAGNAKTVGDVLGLILKRLGGFMVYDRGKLRFGSWAVNNPTPTVVDDDALAEPAISLDFDRTACLQSVEVELGVYRFRNDSGSDARGTIKRAVSNLDLGAAGLGKTTQMGCFTAWNEGATVVNNFILGSSWFANANQAIVRYSQPAARVVVTYRDAVADLVVGETVAFSTAYLPSATGEMGVSQAVGIVIKANRSWKTPLTEYTLLLFGYTQATATAVPLISVAARCTGGLVGANSIPVEAVWFTRGASATGGAPTSDVAAFQQVATLAGVSYLVVVLLDANGTEVGGGADLAEPDVANSRLRFLGAPFLGTTILPGYVITLGSSGGVQGWDALQADAAGEVLGDPALSSPWVQ
jgi:hypothetical protein